MKPNSRPDAEAELANARARESATEALISHYKLQIAKLRREQYGPSAERTAGFLRRWSLSSKIWRPTPPKMIWPPRPPRQGDERHRL
jgi:hypothetical protein